MKRLFVKCHNIRNLELTSMAHMFKDCEKLKNIDVSFFDIENVKCTSYMFADCKKLNEVKYLF